MPSYGRAALSFSHVPQVRPAHGSLRTWQRFLSTGGPVWHRRYSTTSFIEHASRDIGGPKLVSSLVISVPSTHISRRDSDFQRKSAQSNLGVPGLRRLARDI